MSYGLKFCLLFCLLGLLPGMLTNARALQILYPANGTYVTKSNHLIVKGGKEALLDGIMIEIDGVRSDIIDLTSEEYRSLYADKLVVEPIFDPGENTIVVEGYLQGEKVASAKASIYYLSDETKAPPANYTKEVFHLASREESCGACHNMQPSQAQIQDPNPSKNPCASCHARMLSQPHVHGPAGVYECIYCHDADSRPVKYQVKTGDGMLCQECHEEQNAMPVLHGPVAVGMCVVCHDPHASEQPAQLLAEVNQSCLGCHDQLLNKPHVVNSTGSGTSHPLSGPRDPRKPGQKFTCSSCHNPHGGQARYYFVGGVKSRMQLCAECHKK